MNSLMINTAFSSLLEEKLQCKKKVVNRVSEILDMDKKSVYRRLNSEVFFTFSEVCDLSRRLGLSIDDFVLKCYPDAFHNGLLNVLSDDMETGDLIRLLAGVREYMARIADQPDSEMGNLTNYFPAYYHLQKKEIYTLHNYFLHYQAGCRCTFGEFKKREKVRRLVDIAQEISVELERTRHHKIIMGRHPVSLLMKDVDYLKGLELITPEEFEGIKKEIGEMIDKLEGQLENPDDGGTGYDISLSHTVIGMNCYYSWSAPWSMSIAQLYIFGIACSYENERNTAMKTWLDKLKNNSVRITGSSRNERVSFLSDQRRTLERY